MKLLLDTHIFLWYITADPKLTPDCRSILEDRANDVYLSVASIWELVIKHGKGKLPLPAPPAEYLPRQRDAHEIAALPLDEGAMTYLQSLPQIHNDPFDRVLIAQAMQHGLTIVTVDTEVTAYPVSWLSLH